MTASATAVALAVATAGLLVVAAPRARAEDKITIRGVYYREPSTRVVQPIVEISKDVPGGVDVRAHYLLDAITSASMAAGTSTDAIFTEVRNEVGARIGKTFERFRIGLSYRYSAESDYWSHGFQLAWTQRLWGDSATLAAAAGMSLDKVAARARTIDCPRPTGSTNPGCSMRLYGGVLSYTQVLSPTLLAQVSYELAYLDGFQASPYQSTAFGYDKVPFQRARQTVTSRVAYYVPPTRTGIQLYYRYYHDDWSIDGHAIEIKLFQQLSRDLEIRLSYRHYLQSAAYFWCNMMASPDCYGPSPLLFTGDPKLTRVHTMMPEIKLYWDAVSLRGVPFFGWFARGTFDVSYARYIQNTSFGDANVLQAGYTMPY